MSSNLHIFPLGTGNALVNDPGNFHSNFIVQYGAQEHRTDTNTLFVDCGSDFPHALRMAKIRIEDVHNLYVSHVHGDHAGGLEWLALANKYVLGNPHATRLYIPQEIERNLSSMLLPSLAANYDHMRTLGIAACFDTHTCLAAKHKSFIIGNMHCTPVRTLHIKEAEELYSYALFIRVMENGDGPSVFITTDTQFCPAQLMEYYEAASIILHDCSTGNAICSAHAHFKELITLPLWIKKKMYLYHYGPGEKPDPLQFGFKGYLNPRVWITV